MLGYHSVESGTFQTLRYHPQSSPPSKGNLELLNRVQALQQSLAQSYVIQHSSFQNQTLQREIPHPNQNQSQTQNQRFSRLEREVADLRQQQNLLARDKQDDAADLSNILAEMSALKQRLSRALTQAETQLHQAKEASIPAQLQHSVSQLQTEANWLYSTVNVDVLPYYASPSTLTQPVGQYSVNERILILYKTVENTHGLWMQTRQAQEPEKRFWFRLIDDHGVMSVGHFGLIP